MNVLDLVVGKPIKTSDERAKQIGAAQGIPIFGLDALSSVQQRLARVEARREQIKKMVAEAKSLGQVKQALGETGAAPGYDVAQFPDFTTVVYTEFTKTALSENPLYLSQGFSYCSIRSQSTSHQAVFPVTSFAWRLKYKGLARFESHGKEDDSTGLKDFEVEGISSCIAHAMHNACDADYTLRR